MGYIKNYKKNIEGLEAMKTCTLICTWKEHAGHSVVSGREEKREAEEPDEN